MSYDGDITDMHDTAAAVGASADEAAAASNASDVPKHGFGLANSADPATTATAAVNGVELANIITHPSPTEGEVAAPVALAAALAQNQAALDGRPLDGTDSTNGTPRGAVGNLPMVAASPTAHPKLMGGSTAAKKSKAKKSNVKAKPRPKLPMRSNAPGRVDPVVPNLSGTVPVSPLQGKKRAASSSAASATTSRPSSTPLLDEDALAAKVAADAVTASDAAKRKIAERKRKLQKLEAAKKIAAKMLAEENAKKILKAKADAKAKSGAKAKAKADADAKAKGSAMAQSLETATGSAATEPAAANKAVLKVMDASSPAAAVALLHTPNDDPMSPTASIPPLDLAHPSPGTPLPPLPAVPQQPMEADNVDVEEKKQEGEEDDAVLNHALATANAAAVVNTGINTAGGQQTQELCAASALAVAAAAAEESRGDDRMGDFQSAVGGERANPPAKGGPRRRGLGSSGGSEEVGEEDKGKEPEETPKKRGPGRPRKKKRGGSPKAAEKSDQPCADGAELGDKKKTRTPRKKREPLPPRDSSTRQRKQPGLYSDDQPGTVTYEEQFGDGKEKGGKKEMVKDPVSGEYAMKKRTAKEALIAEGLSDNGDDMDLDQETTAEEDEDPVEVDAQPVQSVGRKSGRKDTAKGKASKKRPASDADPEPVKKRGRGRPRKNVDPNEGTDVVRATSLPKGKRTRGGDSKKTSSKRATRTSAATEKVSKVPEKEAEDATAKAKPSIDAKKVDDSENRAANTNTSTETASDVPERGGRDVETPEEVEEEYQAAMDAQKAADAEKAHNLFISREGKNAYFRVELLIGPPDNRVRMIPFSEVMCEDGDLSIDSYVATEGQPFALRVKIARPRSDNCVYGGRVYIDKPCSCKHHERTERLGEQHVCGKKNAVTKQLNEGMDHFFWIGPGETEYMIEGFYKNQATSQQFVFAKPTQELDVSEGFEQNDELKRERMMNIFRSIGGIRISFSLLKKWKKRSKNRSFDPKQASIDAEAFVERKGKELSAQPGEIIEDKLPEIDREAVLSDTIVFEKRIDYNTFCGYKASQTMVKYTNTIGLYKGLPIDILKQEDVRKQCVNMYMTQVPLDRMRDKFHDNLEETFKQTHSSAGQSSSEGAASGSAGGGDEPKAYSKPDKWVPVQAIVRAICRDLSPAGSYLICTGEYHVDEKTGIRNYGETVAQNTEASAEERYVDMEYKTSKLADFFTKDPHIYDSRDCGIDAEGNIRYEVCAAVVDLTGNSDDEFD